MCPFPGRFPAQLRGTRRSSGWEPSAGISGSFSVIRDLLAGRAGETISLIALLGLGAFIISFARSAKEEDA